MPIVVSNKQKIYYELAGDKGPWMILHGPHMIPMNAWKDVGYVKNLEKDFRLVLVEPIGPPSVSKVIIVTSLNTHKTNNINETPIIGDIDGIVMKINC